MSEQSNNTWTLDVLIERAERGDVTSIHALGKHYFESGDHTQAEIWYLRSIELGNVDSMVNIGVLYFTDEDFDKAKYWYQKASEFGDSGAMYNMAVLHDAMGNKEESIEWYQKAAELGDSGAMYNLAIHLDETGRKEESVEWNYKAMAAGDEDAFNNLRILLRELGRNNEVTSLEKRFNSPSLATRNLFLMLSEIEETSEQDKEFNVALRTLQHFSDDKSALNAVSELVDRNHDKSRMASALKYIEIGNEREAIYDLRHVDNVEDPEYIAIIEMLSSVDNSGELTQNQKITEEMADFVLDQWEIISEVDSLYWLDAYWTADITAELFLEGSRVTDYEIDDFLLAYRMLKDDPASPENLE
jgi:tetratricopeptide (TPR) repeat protein